MFTQGNDSLMIRGNDSWMVVYMLDIRLSWEKSFVSLHYDIVSRTVGQNLSVY